MPVNVLYSNGAFIHQDPHSECKSSQRHNVDCLTSEEQKCNTGEQSKGNSKNDDQSTLMSSGMAACMSDYDAFTRFTTSQVEAVARLVTGIYTERFPFTRA